MNFIEYVGKLWIGQLCSNLISFLTYTVIELSMGELQKRRPCIFIMQHLHLKHQSCIML